MISAGRSEKTGAHRSFLHLRDDDHILWCPAALKTFQSLITRFKGQHIFTQLLHVVKPREKRWEKKKVSVLRQHKDNLHFESKWSLPVLGAQPPHTSLSIHHQKREAGRRLELQQQRQVKNLRHRVNRLTLNPQLCWYRRCIWRHSDHYYSCRSSLNSLSFNCMWLSIDWPSE